MKMPLAWLPTLLAATVLAACATPAPADAVPTFVVVRHAEKASDGTRDPPLTEAGMARAGALAADLHDAPLAAVYATAYRRTQMTAAPSAQDHSLAVVTYDAEQPPAEFAAALRRAHRGGTVLVVGHSNTVPGIASALCACAVAPVADDEYDRRLRIRIGADGTATLLQERY